MTAGLVPAVAACQSLAGTERKTENGNDRYHSVRAPWLQGQPEARSQRARVLRPSRQAAAGAAVTGGQAVLIIVVVCMTGAMIAGTGLAILAVLAQIRDKL